MDETQQESLGLYGFQILSVAVGLLSAAVGLLQLMMMMKQGSEGLGVGEGKMSIIFLFVSISFSAFTASVVLPQRYTNILCRISLFFLVLAGSFLLSPFVPHVLFWFPYVACVFPLLYLLQLTPATLHDSLRELCHSSWTAIRDFACGAYERLIRTRGKPTPKGDPKLPTITISSPPPCGVGA